METNKLICLRYTERDRQSALKKTRFAMLASCWSCVLTHCLQFCFPPLLSRELHWKPGKPGHAWAGREQLKLFDYKTTNDDPLLILGLRLGKPKIWQCKGELLANQILGMLIARAQRLACCYCVHLSQLPPLRWVLFMTGLKNHDIKKMPLL